MFRHGTKLLVAAVVALSAPGMAFGEAASADRLLAAPRLKCWFSATAKGVWKEDKVTVVKGGPPYKEPVVFELTNIRRGVARMTIGDMTDDVNVSLNGGLVFRLDSALNITVTTIFTAQTAPGKYPAVMSMHADSPLGPVPTQSYGTCVTLPSAN